MKRRETKVKSLGDKSKIPGDKDGSNVSQSSIIQKLN